MKTPYLGENARGTHVGRIEREAALKTRQSCDGIREAETAREICESWQRRVYLCYPPTGSRSRVLVDLLLCRKLLLDRHGSRR